MRRILRLPDNPNPDGVNTRPVWALLGLTAALTAALPAAPLAMASEATLLLHVQTGDPGNGLYAQNAFGQGGTLRIDLGPRLFAEASGQGFGPLEEVNLEALTGALLMLGAGASEPRPVVVEAIRHTASVGLGAHLLDAELGSERAVRFSLMGSLGAGALALSRHEASGAYDAEGSFVLDLTQGEITWSPAGRAALILELPLGRWVAFGLSSAVLVYPREVNDYEAPLADGAFQTRTQLEVGHLLHVGVGVRLPMNGRTP